MRNLEIDAVCACLMRDGEVIAKHRFSDGQYTVFPVAPSLACLPNTTSDSLMAAFEEFASYCRQIEKVRGTVLD